MSTRTLKTIPAMFALLALLAGPTVTGAAASVRDGRSPDTRDAAYMAHFDGRSPDTIDAAAEAHATSNPTALDLRSPDTRDAAIGIGDRWAQALPTYRNPVAEKAMKARHAAIAKFGSNSKSPARVVEAASDGFHWADAGVGAAGGFALSLLLGAALLRSQRQSRRKLAL